MHHLLFSNPIKKGMQVTLLLAILLFNFSSGKTGVVYAAPSNDNFAGRTTIGAIPFSELNLDTTTATEEGSDPQVNVACDGKLLAKGWKSVWYQYTPGVNEFVSFDTVGTNYDTYIAVWNNPSFNNSSFVGCDDDINAGYQSKLLISATAGTTYYIEIAQYNGTQGGVPTTPTGGTLQFHANYPNINIRVGGTLKGRYYVQPGSSERESYAGLNSGPVQMFSTNGLPMIGAERVIYNVNAVPTSFSEMMGLPNSQLDISYWMPWYNNVDLDTQLRFGNVSGSTATVHLYIGGVERTSGCLPLNSPYTLAPGASLRVSCPGLNTGPVLIVGDVPIVAAERVIYSVNGVPTSFSEMMGLPNSQLDISYWMPWYNNVDLSTQLRFANLSSSTATVHIFIGGSEVLGSPYTLAPGQSWRQTFTGVNNGPVQIVSNVNIVAAERVIYTVNGVPTSFSEMMGLPNSQLSTNYWMPWYNNVDLDTQLRFGRP
jgi:hypothetical protein